MFLLSFLTACSAPPPAPIDVAAFNATNAFRHVETLVGFGPRPCGSDEIRRAGDFIRDELQRYGLAVEEQVFHAGTPRGPMQFRNLVARSRGRTARDGKVIILGSHYDTPHLPGIQCVGANDSGSSTGVLLELARVLADRSGIWFVFFDGEEAIGQYAPDNGLWGSRYFVENLKAEQQIATVRAFVLLDMIGDAQLNIGLPANSTGWLAQEVFTAAQSLGYREYFSYRNSDIIDDHVPFLAAGIPAVDIIDFDYGSAPGRNDYWHTAQDTLDKLSPRSLEIVGQTSLRLVDHLQRNQNGHVTAGR